MAIYQMDSSAIAKRYVKEVGSIWVRSLCIPGAGNIIGIIRITVVEVASAIARKYRGGTITEHERNRALAMFLADCRRQYRIWEVEPALIALAVQLTQRHPLRGYDAVQLAAAILINRSLLANQLSPLIFVSADNRLCTAAAAEGLTSDNPNLH